MAVPDLFTKLRKALADRYAIEGELGEGGMATVYLAEDLKHHRKVALKVLKPEVAATVGAQRFLREIELAARLQHPHILPVHDSGDADGFLYYVMPYVEGESLRDRLERGEPIPIPDAVRLLTEVADALSYAHAHGVVHRDIKPDNVLLSGRHALVVDFGVAKAVSGAASAALSTGVRTATGVALGTPAYMAPEQALADAEQDHRVDIYALGVLGYELLTGRAPFAARTAQEMMVAHVTTPPEPVEKYRPEVSPGLSQVVMKCLAKQPDARWQTAEEVRAQLEPLATPTGGLTPVATRPLGALKRWPRRAPWAAGVVALAVIALVAREVLKPTPLSITASDLTQVTNELGVNYLPAISPDGKEVAYVAGLWYSSFGQTSGVHMVIRSTVNPIGGDEVHVRDTSLSGQFAPWWTSDGDFVRFVGCRNNGCSVYETGKLGGAARPVALPRQTWESNSVDWSPDGARLAYFAADTIFALSLADTTARRLIAVHPRKPTTLAQLVWSPDGSLIAYVDGNLTDYVFFGGLGGASSIWVVSAEGGTPQPVTTSEHLNTSPTWLDARHLLFVSDRDGARAVYVVEVGSRGPRGVPRIIPGVADPHTISYAAKPRQLAWAKYTKRSDIWSYPLVSSAPVSIRVGIRVTSGSGAEGRPDVSADGKWILFQGPHGLSKMPLPSGEAVPFTDAPPGGLTAAWSPDDREVAFSVFRDSGADMLVMPANGGAPVTVVHAHSWNGDVHWSPDGRHIAFMSDRTGRLETWVLSRDSVGGAWHPEVQLTDSGSWVRDWAPDGSGVLCAWFGSRLWVLSLQKRVLWERDLAASGLTGGAGFARFSRDGKTVYVESTGDGRSGVWAIPVAGGAARLVVAFDDPALGVNVGLEGFAVGRDQLYLRVEEPESNIWVAKLHW